MTVILFLLNALCYAGQSATGKQYASKGGQAINFNITKSISATLLFALWLLIQGDGMHIPTVSYAITYGIVLSVSLHAGFKALSCGPMALTSVLVSMSLLIPFLWGLIFWNEAVTAIAVIGLAFILLAIVMIQFKRQNGISPKWIVYTAITTLANGFASVIQKYHQLAYPGQYHVDFMMLAMAASIIPTLLLIMCQKDKQFQFSLPGVGSGLLNGLANFIILLLSSNQNATLLFPLISAGNVIAAWFTGILIFKEHIHLRQVLGLLAGILGIVLLTCK